MKTHFASFVLVSIGFVTTAFADVSHSDKSFLEKAAKSGVTEVAISQGAMDHLSNPELKSFAGMMVNDHSKANSELMTLASSKGVNLPSPDKKTAELTADWSKKTKDLDVDYAKKMVSDHQEAVKLFEKGTKCDDADIAAFATKTLPILQQHLTRIEQLNAALK